MTVIVPGVRANIFRLGTARRVDCMQPRRLASSGTAD